MNSISRNAVRHAPITPPLREPPPASREADALVPTDRGVTFSRASEGASLVLNPAVQIDGRWHRAPAPMKVVGNTMISRVGEAGDLVTRVDGAQVSVRFVAARPCVVESLTLEGPLALPGATGWLSNGFQSWSQSGVLRLGAAPSETVVKKALAAEGEREVYRTGRELSWWYTFVGGGRDALAAGVTSARRLRSWVQAHRDSRDSNAPIRLRLVNGGRERISLGAGEALDGENWMLQLGSDLESMLERYGRSLDSRRAQRPAVPALGWNSWYCLWDDVHAHDVLKPGARRNADRLPELLGPYLPAEGAPPMTVVIDDGWQKAWGDWVPNEKFAAPHLEDLVSALQAKDLRAGIWIAPLLVHPKSDLARNHPDWLVGKTHFRHPAHGRMGILDVTHPEAATHLSGTIEKLVTWGVDLIKLDFLFAGTHEGQRRASVTGVEAYNQALALIRKAAGEEIFLSACGAPPIPSLGYVDGWRVGNDIAFEPLPGLKRPRPGGTFLANQARQYAARYPFCVGTLCDTDPALMRAPLSREEVEAGSWIAAAPGGGLFLSDDLTELPEARVRWGLDEAKVRHALAGQPAVPESFFPEFLPAKLDNMVDRGFTARHHVPEIWRMADGRRVAFNFTRQPRHIGGTEVPGRGVRELPRAASRPRGPEIRSSWANIVRV